MRRYLIRLGLSLLAGACPPVVSAGVIFDLGPSSFKVKPATNGEGKLTDTTSLVDDPRGMLLSNGSFDYIPGASDLGKKVTIGFQAIRPFSITPGQVVNESDLDAVVLLTTGRTADYSFITTWDVATGPGTAANLAGTFAKTGPFTPNPVLGKAFDPPAGATKANLLLMGSISFTPMALSDKITFNFPNSVSALSLAVPEPSGLVLLAVGASGLPLAVMRMQRPRLRSDVGRARHSVGSWRVEGTKES